MTASRTNRLLLRIYGDSLGMPRSFKGISYRDTYPELLKAALTQDGWEVDLYNRSKGGVSIDELCTAARDDRKYFGDACAIVILQCGIVDCAPRPASARMRIWIGRLPWRIQKSVIAFLHNKRARILKAGFCWRITEPSRFTEKYTELLRGASGESEQIIAVGIAPTTPEMEKHSPGLSQSIAQYNQLIHSAVQTACAGVQYVDVHRAILMHHEGVTRFIDAADGHHITAEGHRLYSALLLDAIRVRLSPPAENTAALHPECSKDGQVSHAP